jgi:dihydropteroate synthase
MRVLRTCKKTFELDKRTIIMGILNVTPDSFYDGGRYCSIESAVKYALSMEKQGVDIIDIGGESTRPGAKSITLYDEMIRVIPVIEELVKKTNIPISIDTYKSKIAEKALEVGACMVNDVTALQGDKLLVDIVAEYEVPICIMHMKGNPKNMQINPKYDDIVKEIHMFLKERSEYAKLNYVKEENIIVDPGIGFGKRTGGGIEDNCEILHRLSELKTLGYPIMIGASRKKFIGNVCGGKKILSIEDRLEGSLAAACLAAYNGANIVRVHDVEETRRCLDVVDCVLNKY